MKDTHAQAAEKLEWYYTVGLAELSVRALDYSDVGGFADADEHSRLRSFRHRTILRDAALIAAALQECGKNQELAAVFDDLPPVPLPVSHAFAYRGRCFVRLSGWSVCEVERAIARGDKQLQELRTRARDRLMEALRVFHRAYQQTRRM